MFADSRLFTLDVNLSNPIGSLILTDELIYDLTVNLQAGQQYWFNVDSFSYTVAVPEPSSAMLALLGVSVLPWRRRR